MGDLKSRYTHKFAFLLSDGRGGHNQADADSEKDDDESGPGDESVAAQLVGLARLGPGVRGVDRGVSVDIGSVLVSKLVHAISLSGPAVGVLPVLVLHGGGNSHQILLDDIVLDGVESLLVDVHLLGARGDDDRLSAGRAAGGQTGGASEIRGMVDDLLSGGRWPMADGRWTCASRRAARRVSDEPLDKVSYVPPRGAQGPGHADKS